MGTLNARQVLAVQVSERTMSVLSILGSLFIITTFIRWHYFRKPINRLVFYASFGNMLSNVATLISTSALPNQPGSNSNLCELQAVLIQWFMMADTLWVFCMAMNVMLVFFHGYDSRQLHGLEKWYLVFSYGVPGVTAIIYVILDHTLRSKSTIIGPATIWCWVGVDHEWMRIAFFYAPIWVMISATLCIYVATGHQIFKKRAELRSFTRLTDQELNAGTLSNPFTTVDFRNIKVETEMKVETHSPLDNDPATTDLESRNSFSSTKNLAESSHAQTATPSPSLRTPARPILRNEREIRTGYEATAFSTNQPQNPDGNKSRSFSISYSQTGRRRTAAVEGNAAAWSYFKVAFLMFAALFIVWVPSTVNRLQQFIDKSHPVFGLNLASALVLPLQGFWNAMIYVSTTWPECKRALTETLDALSKPMTSTRVSSYSTNRPFSPKSDGHQDYQNTILLNIVKSRSVSQEQVHSISSAESTRHPAPRSE